MMDRIADVEQRLFVLRNYEKVFLRNELRQEMPECCGLRFDLNLLLRSRVRTVEVELNGTPYLMFEAVCPECGNPIPPTWHA